MILIVKPGYICLGSFPKSLFPTKGCAPELVEKAGRKARLRVSSNCQRQAFHPKKVVKMYISSFFQLLYQLSNLKKEGKRKNDYIGPLIHLPTIEVML